MRSLWPIERAVLEKLASLYPAIADELREQIACARVASFDDTGVGFFSNLDVGSTDRLIVASSPLGEVRGDILGVPDGMGFLLFLKEGKADFLEGFAYSGSSTAQISFDRVVFSLTPGLPHPQ